MPSGLTVSVAQQCHQGVAFFLFLLSLALASFAAYDMVAANISVRPRLQGEKMGMD